MRYLTRHQMLWPESRRSGSNAVYDVITQLQGLDIAAAAWESDILPLRVAEYKREWLDELSLTGEVTWGRLYPPARDPEKARPNASLTRVAPVSICLREDLPWLLATAAETPLEALGSQLRRSCRFSGSGERCSPPTCCSGAGCCPASWMTCWANWSPAGG